MRNGHKEHVLAYRRNGMSYGQIAAKMDMNLNTVKSICRRNHVPKGEEPKIDYNLCLWCGKEVAQLPKRKRKKFCCDKCRHAWWNDHPEKVKRKAYYDITCKHCGKVITVYGDSRRKYCCHECYIAERFGHSDGESD